MNQRGARPQLTPKGCVPRTSTRPANVRLTPKFRVPAAFTDYSDARPRVTPKPSLHRSNIRLGQAAPDTQNSSAQPEQREAIRKLTTKVHMPRANERGASAIMTPLADVPLSIISGAKPILTPNRHVLHSIQRRAINSVTPKVPLPAPIKRCGQPCADTQRLLAAARTNGEAKQLVTP